MELSCVDISTEMVFLTCGQIKDLFLFDSLISLKGLLREIKSQIVSEYM